MAIKRQFTLDNLKPSLGQAKEYASFFEGLVEEMSKEIQSAVLPKAESVAMDSEIGNLVESSLNLLLDKWTKRFDKLSDDWAERIVREQNISAQSKMRRQARKLKAPASLTFNAGPLTRIKLQEKSREISKLIKSIPSDYINDFQEMIGAYGVATPKISVIHEMLDSRYKKHKNKAKNLMLDQTRKTFQGLTQVHLAAYWWKSKPAKLSQVCFEREDF